MRFLFISFFVLSSFLTKGQELALEVMQIIYADSFNLDFIHEDTVLLPDGGYGEGESYESIITIEGFDTNATITDASDIAAIGILMEHSFLGDLRIVLICPNGQDVHLKTFPGGGASHLGEPIDIDNDLNPGVGYYYMFREEATYLDLTTESDEYDILPEGSYTVENNTIGWNGCPINGDWTLEITDNYYSDNGYLFNWQLFFDPAIVPDSLNNGSIILDIVGQETPGLIQTDWYVEWNNGVTGLVNDNLAPGEYTAWLREDGTNNLLDSVHVYVGIGNVNTGINEIEDNSLSIYPNPVQNELNIEWDLDNAQYLVLNSKGQVLNQGVLSRGLNQLNTSAYPSGIYILQVNTGQGVLVKRFIKQ